MEGNEENVKPKELQCELRLQGIGNRWFGGVLLSHGRKVWWVRCKSEESELTAAGNGDQFVGFAVPGLKIIPSRMPMPSFTFSKFTFLPSSHSVLANEEQEVFVPGPAFATDKMPGPVCFKMEFSSSNFFL